MKSEIMKFRATADLKSQVMKAAAKSKKPASDLLRRAARQVAAGHGFDGAVRADMIKVRQAANALEAALSEGGAISADGIARAIRATEALRLIAARHLGPTR